MTGFGWKTMADDVEQAIETVAQFSLTQGVVFVTEEGINISRTAV